MTWRRFPGLLLGATFGLHMDGTDRLPSLIGDIYDASLDPALWDGVLERIAAFVGGQSAALYVKDPTRNNGGIQHESGGVDPSYKRLYFEHYVRLDPTSLRHFFASLDEPIATEDLVPYEEMRASRFYREWAKPQGLVDCITSVVEKTATSVALFGVLRHERHGIADDASRHRMRLLAPHVRRATAIGKAIDRASGEAASLADLLDGLSSSLFLVDERGVVVHANAAGQSLLDDGRVVRTRDGKLGSNNPAIEHGLGSIVASAGAGDSAIGIRGISLPLGEQENGGHVAHVLPLTGGTRRRAGRAYDAAAAIFVREADAATRAPPQMIAEAYRLTPTELRVLLGIVEVGGVPEVAEALGIADTTVKTHLKRLYDKTGATRQADLVKVVARFASPLLA